VAICWDAENNGTTQCSWHDAAYDRCQRWTSLGPLAFTSMFSASQLDKTISGSQGQRDLPFKIVDKKVREQSNTDL